MTKPAITDSAVSVTMAGFIVWLAHQRPSREDRRLCPEQVELFLRWRHHRRAEGLAHDDEAYYACMREAGAGDLLVGEARKAIARLRQYLLTAP